MRIVVGAVALCFSFVWAGCGGGSECSADKPCAQGSTCSADGACVADTVDPCKDTSHPEAPNLIADPGFECGISEWAPYLAASVAKLTQETTGVKTGSGALRLQYVENPKQSKVAAFSKEFPVTPGDTLCYRTFARGTGRNIHMVLRENRPSEKSYFDTTYSSPISVNDWVEVPPSVNLRKVVIGANTTTVHLRFELWQPLDQDAVVLDDVALWKSADGSCTER